MTRCKKCSKEIMNTNQTRCRKCEQIINRNRNRQIEEETAYECPHCGTTHEYEDDAIDCCGPHIQEVMVYRCPECGEQHNDEEVARECCEE